MNSNLIIKAEITTILLDVSRANSRRHPAGAGLFQHHAATVQRKHAPQWTPRSNASRDGPAPAGPVRKRHPELLPVHLFIWGGTNYINYAQPWLKQCRPCLAVRWTRSHQWPRPERGKHRTTRREGDSPARRNSRPLLPSEGPSSCVSGRPEPSRRHVRGPTPAEPTGEAKLMTRGR